MTSEPTTSKSLAMYSGCRVFTCHLVTCHRIQLLNTLYVLSQQKIKNLTLKNLTVMKIQTLINNIHILKGFAKGNDKENNHNSQKFITKVRFCTIN